MVKFRASGRHLVDLLLVGISQTAMKGFLLVLLTLKEAVYHEIENFIQRGINLMKNPMLDTWIQW